MTTSLVPFSCPHCGTSLRLRRDYLGQRVCCRHCQQVFLADEPPSSHAENHPMERPVSSAAAPPGGAVGSDDGGYAPLGDDPAAWRGLAEEFERQRQDRQSERDAHARSLAALREAWDTERRGWRDQLDAVRLHAERERAALQAMTELLRDETESIARRLAERDEEFRGLFARLGPPRDGSEAVGPLPPQARPAEIDSGPDVEELESLRAEVERLRLALAAVPAPPSPPVPRDRSLVRCFDLERWSALPEPPAAAAAVVVVQAVPVGPPPPPPSLEDLEAVELLVAALRRLLRVAAPQGKPYHSQFDLARFQTLQAKLREATLLGERLVSQFDRSRNQKDLLWHLMVAQRNDELNRKKR